MFFYPPFNFPLFNNNPRFHHNNNVNPFTQNYKNNCLNNSKTEPKFRKNEYSKKASELCEAPEAFFDFFGLKLYFDDILIICILFFLYSEKVQNEELFICLILLLLS